jgi:hypothetical protein
MDYYYFQDFCDRLLSTLYPKEYVPVRAGGPKGDMKNDGYCYTSRIFFQAHATRGETSNKTKDKIQEDLVGCLKDWADVQKFVYLTNDTLLGDVENFVDSLRPKHPNVLIETWGHKRLTSEIRKLELSDIEFIIDRKVVPEVSFSESDVISTKFLITNEFEFIKEISENDLSNFPFENPLLFENKTIKFLRELIKNQPYRHTEIEKFVNIEKDNYKSQYPDAQTLPSQENEYKFFYHKRIPKYEELKSTTKDDNISQFLLNNNIPAEKISEILTCYEGECAGAGRFEELYQLRPLYAQFLIVKNISNSPIRLKGLESIFHDGVLYESSVVEEKNLINLPEFLIEPSQNIIIPLGLFLSQFQDLLKLKQDIVTSTYVPNQIQQLELGTIEENQTVEFIGPRLVPTKIIIENQKRILDYDIHGFSFEKVYWVDRHWQCGSCPHLFFIQNGELKYQGEIFSVKPNQIHTERIFIPSMVSELIIAELEQEKTFINYIKKNEAIIENQIVLNEGQVYSISVSPNDCIELEGKYELNRFSDKTMPIKMKYNLIERFKNNYAQQCV